ncbi:DNA repair protein RecO [Mesonia sp. MT50]|uniref:DNA repair protein RecO n=1 Tax=Mesonia profundi TaxID=3070998 RepID=A0ABU0ZXY0_9FLAO|nr:DNA repair protein RecO [Mesonia profundi]MDQ7916165.1 DNA repair protein RecO [Mesonia profundi]
MLINTRAIVIQSIRYSEADLIVKCFTESSGLKSYLCRNILKSKKGKLKASMFQVLTQLDLVANHKDKGTLENIREAKVNPPYQEIPVDVYKSSIALFLAEVLRNSIQEEEKNEALFQFLEQSFSSLDQTAHFANFHLWFLVKLTQYVGFYPNTSTLEAPFFNLLDGDFQLSETNKYCISNSNTYLLKQFLELPASESFQLKLNKTQRKNFLEMMLLYYELHLQGFRKPKSLEILQQIF